MCVCGSIVILIFFFIIFGQHYKNEIYILPDKEKKKLKVQAVNDKLCMVNRKTLSIISLSRPWYRNS